MLVAAIVTYNPSIPLLSDCLFSILPQVDEVFLMDNGSRNIEHIQRAFGNVSNVRLLFDGKNEGIGFRLNQAGELAIKNGADWMLTLDQDSVCPANMIDGFLSCLPFDQEKKIGVICPRIVLRNAKAERPSGFSGWERVESAITSGSLVNLMCWQEVGRFDEELFIDGVDLEYSLRLKTYGWRIFRVNSICLSHDLGDAIYVRFFAHGVFIFPNKPLIRQYYITRNAFIIAKRYYKGFSWVKFRIKQGLVQSLTWLRVKNKRKWIKVQRQAKRDFRRGVRGRLDNPAWETMIKEKEVDYEGQE